MRQNAKIVKIVSDYAELMELLNNRNIIVKDMIPVSSSQIMVSYCYDESVTPIKPDLSILIASHVTCYARVTLFEKIMEIENVCGGDIKNDLVYVYIFNFYTIILFDRLVYKLKTLKRVHYGIESLDFKNFFPFFSFTLTPTRLFS